MTQAHPVLMYCGIEPGPDAYPSILISNTTDQRRYISRFERVQVDLEAVEDGSAEFKLVKPWAYKTACPAMKWQPFAFKICTQVESEHVYNIYNGFSDSLPGPPSRAK